VKRVHAPQKYNFRYGSRYDFLCNKGNLNLRKIVKHHEKKRGVSAFTARLSPQKVVSINNSKLKLCFHGRANPSCSSSLSTFEGHVQLAGWARQGRFFARRADLLLARRAARWICTTVETRLKLGVIYAHVVFCVLFCFGICHPNLSVSVCGIVSLEQGEHGRFFHGRKKR
jgi:hypothetical protein